MSNLPPTAPPPPAPEESEDIPPFLLPSARLPKPSSSSLCKHRTWSPDMYRDEAWERRKGLQMGRRGRLSKSVADDDLDEIKACIELGFSFDSPVIDPKLSNTLPGLPFYHAVLNNKHLHDAASKSPSNSTDATDSSPSTVSPMDSPGRQFMFSPGENPKVVKARLRQWAQVVAYSLRQPPI
ncbi:hypothetical protein SAY87_005778 [Trapa incisa]|uniref:Uncharacterized protein n=1 Tax=Trapa incisa TaxID=236973 RepID=A0AAN7KD22_9MYRT|nr:hypothetical protein SAY87_005778 [Trapa incisa]